MIENMKRKNVPIFYNKNRQKQSSYEMETNTVWTFIIWVVVWALLLGIINQVLVRKWVNPSALHSPHWALYILTRTLRRGNVSNTRHTVMVLWIFSLFNVLKMWKDWKKGFEFIHDRCCPNFWVASVYSECMGTLMDFYTAAFGFSY